MVYKITYANTVADSNPQAINAKYMADRMKELSNGRIEMTVFNNNKLGAFSDCFQQMQQPNGTVQMGDVSSASVTIDGAVRGAIDQGYLVLLGVGPPSPCPSCSPARSSPSITSTTARP